MRSSDRNPAKLWPLLWLAFMAYPVGDLIGHRVAGPDALAAAGLVAFTALYVWLVWLEYRGPAGRERLQLALLGGMAALAVATGVAYGGNWVGTFIYLSAACALALPRRATPAAVALVSLGMLGLCRLDRIDTTNTAFFVFVTAAVGVMVLSSQRTFALVEELRQAREEVARLAVGEERLRFARDLHDLLGHSLSLIVVKSQLARRLLDRDPEAVGREVHDIESVAQRSLVEVREAVSGYHKPVLDTELLGARTALDAAGIETTIDRPAVELPPEVEAVLAWTVREASTNVIRHSGARHSTIRLVPALDQASVEIVDDGHGVNGSEGGGTGLTGLRERLRQAGGRLEAGPRDDGPGFRVRAIVPVASAQ